MRNKVLYVDDEEINLFLFAKRFENHLSILTANSGDEALKQLEVDAQIGIVITDMRMPGMSGLELVEKAQEKNQEVAFFMLTGYEYNEDLEDALKQNKIKRKFKKPFDFDLLLTAIEEEFTQ